MTPISTNGANQQASARRRLTNESGIEARNETGVTSDRRVRYWTIRGSACSFRCPAWMTYCQSDASTAPVSPTAQA